jgi:hypothetical protein
LLLIRASSYISPERSGNTAEHTRRSAGKGGDDKTPADDQLNSIKEIMKRSMELNSPEKTGEVSVSAEPDNPIGMLKTGALEGMENRWKNNKPQGRGR